MSNNESFIDEVTEEVRRDKLFAIFRRYGWIGVVLVVAIVGGAAWTEWQKVQSTARAESFGDAVTAALTLETPEARIAALKAVPSSGDQAGLLQLMLASDPGKDRTGALSGRTPRRCGRLLCLPGRGGGTHLRRIAEGRDHGLESGR